jgi:RNA polymerase sigma-70 factor (ECF subfamily)
MKPSAGEVQPELPVIIGGLIHAHGKKWRGYVYKIVRNHEDAEDVVQEAVRRVLSRDRTFASAEDVRMYLARAVGNIAIEFYHARKRERQRQCSLSECSHLQSEGINPQEYLEEREASLQRSQVIEWLDEGLNSLPQKEYEALRLTMLDARTTSIREAGAGNGIPYSTLRHRSVQGLRRLRAYIGKMLRERSLRLVLT